MSKGPAKSVGDMSSLIACTVGLTLWLEFRRVKLFWSCFSVIFAAKLNLNSPSTDWRAAVLLTLPAWNFTSDSLGDANFTWWTSESSFISAWSSPSESCPDDSDHRIYKRPSSSESAFFKTGSDKIVTVFVICKLSFCSERTAKFVASGRIDICGIPLISLICVSFWSKPFKS